jgi:hypothetical protein
MPFKGHSPHVALASPTDRWQSAIFDIPALHLCSRTGYASPAVDTPLGYICYTFRPSIRTTFLKHSQLVRNVFEGSLVISDLYDQGNCTQIYMYYVVQHYILAKLQKRLKYIKPLKLP